MDRKWASTVDDDKISGKFPQLMLSGTCQCRATDVGNQNLGRTFSVTRRLCYTYHSLMCNKRV
ncbi:hypothetical protein J6590_100292 [Homalodisca vitripennis]|nr:hypothetical protein J6590_100292 [Homalodisca vitripennis]